MLSQKRGTISGGGWSAVAGALLALLLSKGAEAAVPGTGAKIASAGCDRQHMCWGRSRGWEKRAGWAELRGRVGRESRGRRAVPKRSRRGRKGSSGQESAETSTIAGHRHSSASKLWN